MKTQKLVDMVSRDFLSGLDEIIKRQTISETSEEVRDKLKSEISTKLIDAYSNNLDEVYSFIDKSQNLYPLYWFAFGLGGGVSVLLASLTDPNLALIDGPHIFSKIRPYLVTFMMGIVPAISILYCFHGRIGKFEKKLSQKVEEVYDTFGINEDPKEIIKNIYKFLDREISVNSKYFLSHLGAPLMGLLEMKAYGIEKKLGLYDGLQKLEWSNRKLQNSK
jgi:hypothetical protein